MPAAGPAGELTQWQALGGSLLEASADPMQPCAPQDNVSKHTLSVMSCAPRSHAMATCKCRKLLL